MHYSQVEIDIPPKINYNLSFFFDFSFSLVLLKNFLKTCKINSLSTIKYGQNNKKMYKCTQRAFHSSFMVICLFLLKLLVYYRKKEIEERSKQKEKEGFDAAFGGLCIFAYK